MKLRPYVKGEGYAIHETLEVESSGVTGVMELVAGNAKNAVELGQVIINERCMRQISFVNSGRACRIMPATADCLSILPAPLS